MGVPCASRHDEGRPTTRVNWLIRQLKAAPEALRVEAFTANQRGDGTAELLSTVRENPAIRVYKLKT